MDCGNESIWCMNLINMIPCSKEFKLRAIKHAKASLSSVSVVAELKKISRRSLYNWIESYNKFWEGSLENKKAWAKDEQTQKTFTD